MATSKIFSSILTDSKMDFTFRSSWNYPEVSLVNSVYFNNITCFTSGKRTLYSSPRLILYFGPGNFTWNNISVLEYGTGYIDSTVTASFASSSACIPNDGVIQIVNFSNWTLSMPNLPTGSNLLNGIAIRFDYNLYRNLVSNITRMNFTNYIPAFGAMIFWIGTYTQTIWNKYLLNTFYLIFLIRYFDNFQKFST